MKIKVKVIDGISKIIAIFIGIAFCMAVMGVTVKELNAEAGVEILVGIVMVLLLLPIGVALAFAPVARKKGKICRVVTGILMLPTFVLFLGLSTDIFNSKVISMMSLFITILYIIQYYLLFKEVIEYSWIVEWFREIGVGIGLFILFIFGGQLLGQPEVISLRFKMVAIFISVISIWVLTIIGRSGKMNLIDWITKITAVALAFDTAAILAIVNTASGVSEEGILGTLISSFLVMGMLQIGLFLAPTVRKKWMRYIWVILMLPGFALSFILGVLQVPVNFSMIADVFANKIVEKNIAPYMGKVMVYSLGIIVYLIQYWLLLKDIVWKAIYLLSLIFKRTCGRIKTFPI